MKRALIASNEKSFDGYRVCDIVEVGCEFGVAPGLFWVDCEDDIESKPEFWYDPKDNTIKKHIPPVVEPTDLTQPVAENISNNNV